MSDSMRSYSFGQFTDNASELRRLEAQADLGWREIDCRILARTSPKPGQRVLDLGCGPGFIARRLSDMVGKNGEVVGVDLNESLLTIAHNRNASSQVRFANASVYDLTSYRGEFDFVYARLLFQHLEDPEKALNQIWQTLAPGGVLIVVDIDDGVFTVLPEPPGFVEFTQEAAAHQQRQGGDVNAQ
ncbi:hypothetical protein WCLP8_1000003 [uncultured Gammaproteobacteria bacterium]